MTDRNRDMDAVRSAEFKEAFDEFDKVRGQLVEEKRSEDYISYRTSQGQFPQRNCWVFSERWDKIPQRMNCSTSCSRWILMGMVPLNLRNFSP